ncbi:MAG TPA: hypothetical protein VMD59_15005 [Acidimicrobiales bacterium]|nr:hypothetical protein [Acidimicrobiales bacterium]
MARPARRPARPGGAGPLPGEAALELAGSIALAWQQLSAMCHHDAYELPPLPGGLLAIADVIEGLGSTS